MKPQTAQQINDPQTGQVSTSRHSALSELMVQNVELRAEVERLKAENAQLLNPTIELLNRLGHSLGNATQHEILTELDSLRGLVEGKP